MSVVKFADNSLNTPKKIMLMSKKKERTHKTIKKISLLPTSKVEIFT